MPVKRITLGPKRSCVAGTGKRFRLRPLLPKRLTFLLPKRVDWKILLKIAGLPGLVGKWLPKTADITE